MMKKLLFLFLFFNVTHTSFAQKNEAKISLQFENATKIEIIEQIESVTDYRFYFIESWIDDTLISGNYNNAPLKTVLNDIFKNTVINYYISTNHQIILTNNSLIRDELPINFIENESTKFDSNTNSEPVFFNEGNLNKNEYLEIIKIGKETTNASRENFKLSGYVRNKVTKEPLVDLVLMVKNQDITAVTNQDGFYSLTLPSGENLIEFKSLVIKDLVKKIVIYNDGKANFDLDANAEVQLDEIVITSQKDRNVAEVIAGITKIELEEIKTIPLVLGERDLLKIATALPGISTAGEGASGYNVRGGKADQNLILIDEGIVYSPTHFFGIFSALNPYTVGSLEIYKGNIPVEFGGRLSSVFDIKTKKSNIEKLSGEAAIGPVTSNLMLEIPVVKEKSSLLVGARGTYSDWVLKSLDDESLNNSEASFYDFIIKYDHKINDNNTIETTGYYSKDKFSITSDSLYSYSNQLATLKWNHTFNKKSKGSVILNNSQYQFNIGFEGNGDKNFDLNYKINETLLKLKMSTTINDKHKLNYGVSSKLYTLNPGSKEPLGENSIIEPIIISKERALESAVFISDNFKVNKKLSLSLGLRYSFYASLGEASERIYEAGQPRNEGTLIDTKNHSKNEVIKTYGGLEIRTSARYFLTEDLSIKGGYSSTFQYIHALSNNTTQSPLDTWKLSDSNIKPQQANQFNLGIYKNLEDYELSVEAYYKTSKDILDYKVGADLLLNELVETEVFQGVGKSYGVEFLAKKNKGNLNGWLAYSYSRSLIKLDSEFSEERVNNGEYFPANYDKPHDFSLVANYKMTKRFSVSFNFAYQTGRPVTYPVGTYTYLDKEYALYSNRNEFRIPDYFRLDLGLNIEGNHKIKKLAHSFWNISIYNVLGRNNPYSVFFVTENGQIKAYKSSIFSIPVPTITYNIKF
ncbi:TonB-dependent receptor [Hwangdonia lutea]|uniref:TonB-dependent receptor n=1 Tax=Hwangdonia lutea TaxID=3075823 RepID=A0AA97EM58_9FLAO|nr:TonB-dependent receptor [Hwangdonia sp. SCSIO 19198]WOD43025.1 TonB-dependent receptor [Hwangdonia sp. SCSIO 19198]